MISDPKFTVHNNIHTSVKSFMYMKDLQQKGDIHQIVSQLECKTAVIFQALIPTLNAFQISGGINL